MSDTSSDPARAAWREFSAARFVDELDSPVDPSNYATQLRSGYSAALDRLIRFVVDSVTAKLDGEAAFSIASLAVRGVNDLLAGFHLLSHYYLVQMYSVTRPISELSDLIRLFEQSPEEAVAWVNPDQETHRRFQPANVREQLGRPRFDPGYAHFSESGTHPRFAGAQLTGFFVIPPGGTEDDRYIRLRVGPFEPDHPACQFAAGFLLASTVDFAFALSRVPSVSPTASHVDWAKAISDFTGPYLEAHTAVLARLAEHGYEVSEQHAWADALRGQVTDLVAEIPEGEPET